MNTASHLDQSNADEGPEPFVTHGIMVGAVVGVIAAFVASTIGMVIAGIPTWGAAGFALFVAFWGGLGFGSMMGGVAGYLRWAAIDGDDH